MFKVILKTKSAWAGQCIRICLAQPYGSEGRYLEFATVRLNVLLNSISVVFLSEFFQYFSFTEVSKTFS